MYHFNQYKKLIAVVFVLFSLHSCYQYDPIDAKERMIASLKNNKTGKDDNKQGAGSEEDPTPIPDIDPKPKDDETSKTVEHHFSFDTWKQVPEKPYYLPVINEKEDPSHSYWVSASNNGYTNFTSDLSLYPVLELKEGYKKSGVQLISRKPIGTLALFSPKIISGALYSGKVEGGSMNTNPVRFGHKWSYEPSKLKVFVKYKSGDEPIGGLNGKDQGSISAVFYDVTDNSAYLDKNTIDNDSRIVLKAYTTVSEQAEWRELVLDFKVMNEAKYEDLNFKNRKYRLAIIFSSSAKGDDFIGAIGSTLSIDELTIFSKEVASKSDPTKPEDKPSDEDKSLEKEHFSFDLWKKMPKTKGTFSVPVQDEEVDPLQSYWVSASNLFFDEKGGNYSYPVQELKDSKKGSGIFLISRSTYPNLPYVFIPGEIYTGQTTPTSMGQDWNKGIPKKLVVNYKYKSGPLSRSYIYGGLKGKDKGLIKAVLYEVTDKEDYYLNNDELKLENNERIILEAKELVEEQDWGQELTIKFRVRNEDRYKSLDFEQKKYRLAIILSSSYLGHEGKGIWNSTMKIDELTVYYEKK